MEEPSCSCHLPAVCSLAHSNSHDGYANNGTGLWELVRNLCLKHSECATPSKTPQTAPLSSKQNVNGGYRKVSKRCSRMARSHADWRVVFMTHQVLHILSVPLGPVLIEACCNRQSLILWGKEMHCPCLWRSEKRVTCAPPCTGSRPHLLSSFINFVDIKS